MDKRGFYEPGDKIEVQVNGRTIRAVAVPSVKDSNYCLYCCFFSYCRDFEVKKGTSDIGIRCYNTVFNEK